MSTWRCAANVRPSAAVMFVSHSLPSRHMSTMRGCCGTPSFKRAVIKRAEGYSFPDLFDMKMWTLKRDYPDWDFRTNMPKFPELGRPRAG